MKIFIDNGHGQFTAGKRSPDGQLREAFFNREIARRIVLERRDGFTLLWTAYPIEYKHTYEKLMKEYEAYKKARTATK